MISGKVWTFGDDINTDLMVPGPVLYQDEHAQAQHLFSANRPGWINEVGKGDIVVAGANFGVGSARPGARSLRVVGIACLLADSLNGLFFRSCISYGLLAMECRGVSSAFNEGDVANIDFENFVVRNTRTGETLKLKPVPFQLLEMMQAGGVYPLLEAKGLVGRFSTAMTS